VIGRFTLVIVRRLLLVMVTSALLAALSAASAAASSEPPAITSVSVDNVGPTIATLQAQLDPQGLDTSYRFEYGPTPAYGTTVPVGSGDVSADSHVVGVEQPLTELAPDSNYHYRLVAINAEGTTASEDETFSTFGIKDFAVTATNADGSPDSQAGSHPYEVTSEMKFPVNKNRSGETVPAGAPKDISIDLPPGLVGDPQAVPQCPARLLVGAFLGASHCPADTQIGLLRLQTPSTNVVLPIYNLVPPAGAPAQFGVFVLLFPIVIDASVRPGDYGMTVSLSDLSQVLPITGASLTLWGVPADPSHDAFRGSCLNFEGVSSGNCPSEAVPNAFLTLPPRCGSSLTFALRADAWGQPGTLVQASADVLESAGEPLDLIGCEKLNFAPAADTRIDTASADSPVGVTIDITTPSGDPRDLASPGVRDLTLALPQGMSINPSAADGLNGCSALQIALSKASEPLCPNSSKIGSAEVDSPLLAHPLTGSVYLAVPGENPFGSLLAAYVAVQGDGVSVKVPVQFLADPVNGRLLVVINGLPDLPFSHFELSLHGGARAALANPDGCGTFATQATLTPYSAPFSGPPLVSFSDFAVNNGCAGGFAPLLVAGLTSLRAGRETGFVFQLAREDGQEHLGGLSLTLPRGLLASLGGIPPCASEEAARGACPTASRIGTATMAAGAGSHPFYLSGDVFLSGPYRDAPFGLSIVVPVHVGPFELGTIVLRAQVSLAPRDLRLTIAPDPLPQIVSGIPLRLRAVDLAIDRPGFLINPTDCTSQAITGVVSSFEGLNVPFSRPMRVTGCAKLPFSPRLAVTASASAKGRAGSAGLQVSVASSSRSPQANIKSLSVTLSGPLRPRLTTIQKACPTRIFRRDSGECPRGSLVGRATLTTPVLKTPLTGPIYLIFSGRRSFPNLAMLLHGQGLSIELNGVVKIGKKGVISTDFTGLPDAPIKRFTFDLQSGPGSILGALPNLCSQLPTLHDVFVAHNGARVAEVRHIPVQNCHGQ
jgi:hypothetical protein